MIYHNGKAVGMGAIPRADGLAFRLWAPNAQQVALVGTFNAWDSNRHLMEREGNGYWYAQVPEARKGHEYRYLLRTPAGELYRTDPYARQVTEAMGNAVVHDPEFDWEGDDCRMPPWNELILYEMHVGTFNALTAVFDESRSVGAVRDALHARYNGDAFQRVIYTESHDDVANGKCRLAQDIHSSDPAGWHAQKRSTLGAGVLLTAPGIPMLFQGQEFLTPGCFSDSAPLDWGRCDRHAGIVQMYRDLVALRRDRAGVSRGLGGQHMNVFHANEGSKVLAYHRWDRGGKRDDVVVVANFSHRTHPGYVLGFPCDGRWRLRFNSDWQGYSGLFGGTASGDCCAHAGPADGMPCRGAVTVGPYSVLIYSQDG
jgi:1,4-alpha-glucan branching enzyme